MSSPKTPVFPPESPVHNFAAGSGRGLVGLVLVAVLVVSSVHRSQALDAAYVHIRKSDAATDTRMHIGEVEAFAKDVVPDAAGGATFDGLATSTNDIGDGSLTTFGDGNTLPTLGTTTTLEHGGANKDPNNVLETAGAVWTTRVGQSTQPQYTLDLGGTHDVTALRMWPRADGCCAERWRNLEIQLLDADRNPIVGSERLATSPGGNVPLQFEFPVEPVIERFVVSPNPVAPGSPAIFSWDIDPAATAAAIPGLTADALAQTVDGSGSIALTSAPAATTTTTYVLSVTSEGEVSTAEVTLVVEVSPIVRSFAADLPIVASGDSVVLSWDVENFDTLQLDGVPLAAAATSATVNPTASTTYTLIATNASGSTTVETGVRVVVPGEPVISEFMANNGSGLRDEDGDRSDWIELWNPSFEPAALDGYYLTDDASHQNKWRLPAVVLEAGGYLVVFASGKDRVLASAELHTDFSLRANGEYLALLKPDGVTVVTVFSPTYPAQRQDVSYGHDALGIDGVFFTPPTPGEANGTGFTGFVGDTTFSIDRGFYTTPIAVVITSSTTGAEIRYTVDGTPPTATAGEIYSDPVPISETTVLRASAFETGLIPTNIDTQTYIFPADVITHPNMATSITQDPIYGPQMVAALQAVPTVSLVFEGEVNRSEKVASVELINFEAGSTQVDAGMERFGNFVTNFPKRGIRLNFRRQYGPAKLDFPVFDGHDYPIPPAAEFDSIDLRSGNHDMVDRGAYMSNRFVDDTMLDMGQIAPHGRFVHVYLNGVYWGQYHMRERWNASMLAEYFDGTEADYEAINANNFEDEFLDGVVYDGSGEHWAEAQVRVASPTPFASARDHIDMAGVFDFMMLWVSGFSESEFRAAGSVPLGEPFKFFMKDADGFLRPPQRSLDHNGPLDIMTALRVEGDPDYEMLLADEIHRNYFNGGAFTPAANIARLQTRVDEIAVSFLAESARWGFRTPGSWQVFQTDLVDNHFPGLTATMIDNFQSTGHYPSIVAPSFNQHGGTVAPGFQLAITAPAGTIYYTIDGSDPRQAIADGGVGTGSVAATAILYDAPLPIAVATEVKARVLDGGGNWSALNAAIFTQDFGSMVVSELMYNPAPPTPAESAAGHDDSEDFEYIELLNTGATPLDLTGLRLDDGVAFDFSDGTITLLAPGARLLVVEDMSAFAYRYGAGHPVAGQYGGKFRDEGERVALADALGRTVRAFTYDNAAPWPVSAAGGGASLVLADPASLPDHSLAASWVASSVQGGTPGGGAVVPQTYGDFAAATGAGAAGDDEEGDGLANLAEFVLGGNPFEFSPAALPQLGVQSLPSGGGVADFLTLTFTHNLAATDVVTTVEASPELSSWQGGVEQIVLHRITYHGDGMATSVYRSASPITVGASEFFRLRFEESAP